MENRKYGFAFDIELEQGGKAAENRRLKAGLDEI